MGNICLISVIVPVYNVEPYLRRSLDSLITQSHRNLEIILVNDGSTDKSGEICNQYVEKDSRIKVLHKENGGVSSARNAGLEIATGEYIGFLDPDDWAEPDLYRFLYDCLKENNAEVSICGHFVHVDERLTETRSLPEDTGILDKEKALAYLIALKSYDSFLWNKLFAKRLIKRAENGHILRFNESIHIGEDLLFACKCLLAAERIAYLSNPLYHYMLHSGGLSHSFNLKNRITEKDSWQQIAALLPPKLSEKAIERYYDCAFNVMRIAIIVGNKREFAGLKKITAPYLRKYVKSPNVKLRSKIRAALIVYCPYLSGMIWVIIKKALRIGWHERHLRTLAGRARGRSV